jgi:hypothetical protein
MFRLIHGLASYDAVSWCSHWWVVGPNGIVEASGCPYGNPYGFYWTPA